MADGGGGGGEQLQNWLLGHSLEGKQGFSERERWEEGLCTLKTKIPAQGSGWQGGTSGNWRGGCAWESV